MSERGAHHVVPPVEPRKQERGKLNSEMNTGQMKAERGDVTLRDAKTLWAVRFDHNLTEGFDILKTQPT